MMRSKNHSLLTGAIISFFQRIIILAFICLLSLGGCSKYSDEVQANLTKIKKTKACSGCDLTGIELVAFDLENANLTDANLASATLIGATLRNTNLTGVKLSIRI